MKERSRLRAPCLCFCSPVTPETRHSFISCPLSQVLNGHFVHYFAPKDLPAVPKNVVFVIDTSASMLGKKIRQVRAEEPPSTSDSFMSRDQLDPSKQPPPATGSLMRSLLRRDPQTLQVQRGCALRTRAHPRNAIVDPSSCLTALA